MMKFNENITYHDAEVIRLNHISEHPYSKKEMQHPRTKNWHGCFGQHAAIGCDGCDHWILCMELTFNNGWRREEKVKGEFFKGVVVIIVEEETT